jgi:hypothetical protein
MIDLKPIQTFYDGYWFRSRLEARWAVFFKHAGWKYQYEVEGFHLPSGMYLPDFYLPDYGYVEVKPGPKPPKIAPRVYFAGRVNGYREDWARNACDDSHYCSIRDGVEFKPRLVIHNNGEVLLTYWGPMVLDYEHGGEKQGDHVYIFRSDWQQIDSCDIFFALIEDREAYGTLVEIGIAYGRGIREKGPLIVVGMVDPDHYNCGDGDDCDANTDMRTDLWFANECAEECLSRKTRDDVLSKFMKWMRANHPPPRELQLAAQLHVASGGDVAVVYGDPLDVCDTRSSFSFGDHSAIRNLRTHIHGDAARAARSARFEHGEKPPDPPPRRPDPPRRLEPQRAPRFQEHKSYGSCVDPWTRRESTIDPCEAVKGMSNVPWGRKGK